MNRDHDSDKRGSGYGAPSSIPEWVNTIMNTVIRMLGGTGGSPPPAPQPPSSQASSARATGIGSAIPGIQTPQGPRRTLVGYINTGIYKYEQARRSSALARQYSEALHTIRLTRRAVRNTPRSSRYLFEGYAGILRDAKRRVKDIYVQIRQAEAHMRRYDPHAINDEIRKLELAARNAASESARVESEMRMEARRDLLATVQSFDDRIESLAAQLGTIAAALELNHVKIVTISGTAVYTSQDDLLTMRMQEVTEQLKLLEESLKELGR